MKSPLQNKQFKNLLSYFLLAVAIIIVYKFIMAIDIFWGFVSWFLKIISPFILGFVIAYVLNIPCEGIQKLCEKSNNKFLAKKRKTISIILVYLCTIIIIFLAAKLIVPKLYRSASTFGANFTSYYKSAQNFVEYLNDLEIIGFDISIDEILYAIRDFTLNKLPSSINALFNVSSGILNSFISIITSIYFLIEKNELKKYSNRILKAVLPKNVYNISIKYIGKLNMNFKQYIYTQTIDGCILGVIATIELLLLKSPYALMLGIMLGIVNYIPYFGSIFGSLIAVLVVAFTQDIKTGVLTGVILLVTQQIDANIIQPRLMSGSFALSPLLIIISISIGGSIFGILGMIVAIPIVAVAKDIIEEILLYYENQKNRIEI